MEHFIWQNESWPHFFWNPQSIIYPLAELYKKQGLLEGLLKTADLITIKKLAVNCFTSEIVNSYKLEGENLNESALKAMVSERLGLDENNYKTTNSSTASLSNEEKLRLDVIISVFFEIITLKEPLTTQKLKNWNKQLSITFVEDEKNVDINDFRIDEYSYCEKDKICYKAPAPNSISSEMEMFINWFNKCGNFQELDTVLKSAITQFYLIAIQPFKNNSNIIARMLSYSVLYNKNCIISKSDKTSQEMELITSCLYSQTSQTVKYKADYIYMLLQISTGNTDMTVWLSWAIKNSIQAINAVLTSLNFQPKKNIIKLTEETGDVTEIKKEKTQQKNKQVTALAAKQKATKKKSSYTGRQKSKKAQKPLLNKRQTVALEYMKTNTEKKITTSEYSKQFNCSQDTAARDIGKLIKLNFIEKGDGGGRSTSYSVKAAASPENKSYLQ